MAFAFLGQLLMYYSIAKRVDQALDVNNKAWAVALDISKVFDTVFCTLVITI